MLVKLKANTNLGKILEDLLTAVKDKYEARMDELKEETHIHYSAHQFDPTIVACDTVQHKALGIINILNHHDGPFGRFVGNVYVESENLESLTRNLETLGLVVPEAAKKN